MDSAQISYCLTWIGTACWILCFWWMHKISQRQNHLLKELHDQGKRIEKFSRIEHDLIKEVHPQVNEIKKGLQVVVSAVKAEQSG